MDDLKEVTVQLYSMSLFQRFGVRYVTLTLTLSKFTLAPNN